MTDEAVEISITIRVAESERKIEEKINLEKIEETIQRIAKKVGRESLEMNLREIDKQIAEQVPRDWQNVGTEERWMEKISHHMRLSGWRIMTLETSRYIGLHGLENYRLVSIK